MENQVHFFKKITLIILCILPQLNFAHPVIAKLQHVDFYLTNGKSNKAMLPESNEFSTSQQKLSSTNYTAYGKGQKITNAKGFGYNREYTDENSNLVYLRARFYHPATQTFITRDTKIDEWNKYGFTGGNPVMNIDPSGHGIFEVLTAILDEEEANRLTEMLQDRKYARIHLINTEQTYADYSSHHLELEDEDQFVKLMQSAYDKIKPFHDPLETAKIELETKINWFESFNESSEIIRDIYGDDSFTRRTQNNISLHKIQYYYLKYLQSSSTFSPQMAELMEYGEFFIARDYDNFVTSLVMMPAKPLKDLEAFVPTSELTDFYDKDVFRTTLKLTPNSFRRPDVSPKDFEALILGDELFNDEELYPLIS
ncbi:RHS repeat-associated core domain-containing protein [Facilibium subflavum]|uniref:RHS repeat-associated core domain-containing protein n=1 Tax=Facilibium subflavum TaxID=2219058 RepID=UPI000E6480D2|nr:RHS repeat-associated core domain-containing protein [Facilibium subflavum]